MCVYLLNEDCVNVSRISLIIVMGVRANDLQDHINAHRLSITLL